MHLVVCATPTEPIEEAPSTGLLADLTDGAQWEGFWSSDAYLVRRTTVNGEETWFRVEDDVRHDTPRSVKGETRVLHFPSAARLQTRVVVAQAPDGRRMLVGSSRRTRTSTRRAAE